MKATESPGVVEMSIVTLVQVKIRMAAFRCTTTGEVVETGSWHDILRLPGGVETDLDLWVAGFTDCFGRFLDRAEAAAAVGANGRLEARSFFAGEADPTLEAGRTESWRREDVHAAA